MATDDPAAVYSGPFPIHPADTLFYAQAGACLMEWSAIDSIMFNICASALGTSDEIASVVYRRTPTIESQTALIADLIAQRFPKKPGEHDHSQVKAFDKLRNRTTALMKTRNKIAHGGRAQIMHVYAGPQPAPTAAGPGFHSVVTPSPFKKSDGTDLNLAALREHQRAVFALATDLRAYRKALREALPG